MYIKGLKIFLINSDFSSSEMEEIVSAAFSNGYELHFLLARSGEAIRDKIKRIAEIYEESLILVNIDRKLSDIHCYVSFIKDLIADYECSIPLIGGDEGCDACSVKIGVTHSLSPNKINRIAENKLEHYYINVVKPCAGFFTFDIHLQENIRNLLNYFDSYEYLRGYRRHTIRMIGSEPYEKIAFRYLDADLQFRLLDISMSHFSVYLPSELCLKQYTKLTDIQIFLKSVIIKTDCVLTLVREGRSSGLFCLFTFLHGELKNNRQEIEVQGLSEKNKQKVSQAILKKLQTEMDYLMSEESYKIHS